MPQQLIMSSLHNYKLVERLITLIHDTARLSRNASATAAGVAAVAAVLCTWEQCRSSRNKHTLNGIPTPKGAYPIVGMSYNFFLFRLLIVVSRNDRLKIYAIPYKI